MIDIDGCIDLTDVPEAEWREKYIGDGYRYCSYVKQRGENIGRIVLFGYDKNGNPTNFTCRHRPHIKYTVKYKTKEKDIFGRYVETRYFDNVKSRRRYVEASGGALNIIECFKPENEFLHRAFDPAALDETFNTQTLRTFFYDIETEIGESFELPKNARQRINALSIYDTLTKKYYVWSLRKFDLDLEDEYDEGGNLVNECRLKNYRKDQFEVFDFFNDDETRMLRHFLDWWERNYPDVFASYNGQSFDDVYLVNRIERVLGDPENVDAGSENLSTVTKRLSPVGKVSVRTNNLDNERANKGAEQIASIDGIFQADILVLFRDKFKIAQPLDGGNSLDNVGETQCGIHKIRYKNIAVKGHPKVFSLKELYERDWNRFIKYNLMDVEVLKTVEEKVKTISLSRAIVSSGLCNYDNIYSTVSYLTGSLSMYANTQVGVVFPSKTIERKPLNVEGAFVFDPIPGLYKGGIMCVDFTSLYPSIIRSCNISTETYVGKISRFPISDPTSDMFVKEPPIDLNGSDIIPQSRDTENDKLYKAKYGQIIKGLPNDPKIEKFYLLPANGSGQKVITRKQLDILLETKCIFTRNNTLFLKHSVKQGVISAWCRHFFTLRKQAKKKMQKLDKQLYDGEIPEEQRAETMLRIQNLNDRQQSLKILINSCFGLFGCSTASTYSPYICQTITRQGKFCNISTSEYVKKLFNEKYGDKHIIHYGLCGDGSQNTTYSISGDTDSLPFSAKIRIKIANIV